MLVTVPRVGLNELADSPLQRDGPIYRLQNVVIDSRLSGVRADGTNWVGTPLFDASGYVDSIPLTADQLLTGGGNITLNGIVAAGKNSVLSVAGGYTQYQGGLIDTTKLIAADGGRIVDIGSADPNTLYAGIVGDYTLTHPRWGGTEAFTAPLPNGQGDYEPGYVQGADAGTLSVQGFGLVQARLFAGAVEGPYQRQGSALPSAPAKPGAIDLSLLNLAGLTIAKTGSDPLASWQPANAIPTEAFLFQTWSANSLTDAQAASYKIAAAPTEALGLDLASTGSVSLAADAVLDFLPGTSLSVSAHDIDLAGKIRAPSGALNFSLAASMPTAALPAFADMPRNRFTLESGAVLDVSGQWINDRAATRDTLIGSDYVNGGSVSIFAAPDEQHSRFRRPISPM